jgi:hypothetical protein
MTHPHADNLPAFDERDANAFAEQIGTVLDAGTVAVMLSIGHRTGLFDVLADLPPATSSRIADHAALAERYVREWLAVHDQKDPGGLIRSLHQALRADGIYLMQDIGGSAYLEKNLDFPMASLLYAISCVHCTPVSLAQGGEGLGTMWGWERAQRMLHETGFASTERHVLPKGPDERLVRKPQGDAVMKRDQADNTRVVIVGAGSAGLAVAHALRRTGIAVRILDKGARVAETWRQRHPQLRLNTHQLLSGLPGLSMPASDGAFPRRDTVVHYLETYASRLGVPIEFGVNVEGVDPVGQGWRVQTDHRAFFAEHVIFATGHDRVPHVPGYPGLECYGGETRHAAGFGDLAHYRNRKVLVVGAGNSGSDVLNHLAGIETDRLWVSIRHGPVVFPTRLAGIPVQLLSPLPERLPVRLVDRLLTLTERVAFGDLSRWGLRRHEKGGATPH